MGMAGKLMYAIQYDSHDGGPAALKHVEVPVPSPQKYEVLLKLEATSLNPIDWKIQKGKLRPFFPRKFPYIPGTDVAGEVVEVGAEVKNFKIGDRVVAELGHLYGGGLAEYAVAKESLTAVRPAEVSAAEGAGLLVSATCGACNIELVKSIGGDEVLDYKTPKGAALKSPLVRNMTLCSTVH
ncbi:chloroplast envelope quinone oxidoreductase [Populus alba x Populus x berolinensis]|nr:chloroplast envelope quinone oxidoreductase [Populus alba x Populus x berolinensis]